MKYKIGDYVVILDGREKPSRHVWVSSMTCHIGRIGKVVKIDPFLCDYVVDVDGDQWWYEEKWLAPAIKGGRSYGKMLSAALSMSDKIYSPRRIYKGKGKTAVLWADGTKTIVKRAEGEADNDYAAFTAALAIKIYGTNSAVNRIVRKTEVAEKKRKKKREEPQKKNQVTKIGFIISPENITISREEV